MIRNFLESCDYEQGYSKALIDVRNFFEKHSASMKYNKLYNQKSIEALLLALQQNRNDFMELGEDLELSFKKEGSKITFYKS